MISEFKPYILIVDDIPVNLIALSSLLKKVDATVIQANSGNEALAMVLDYEFALILLDAHMPDMDGYEVAEILTAHEETSHIPIIFVTAAYKDELSRRKGYQAGAVDYIQKPIEEDILLSKVNVFLELHRVKLSQQQLIEKMDSLVQQRTDELLATQRMAKVSGWKMDIKTRRIEVDSQTRDILGIDENKSPSQVIKKAQKEEVFRIIDEAIDAGLDTFEFEFTFESAQGEEKTAYSIANIIYEDGQAVAIKGSVQDISERKEAERMIKFMAQYDPLTELPNRYLFQHRLSRDIARAKRNKNRLAILLIDMDHFKEINDTLGHPIGDALLKEVANRLQSLVRETDTVARLGGDEFVIIAPELEETISITSIAQRCIDRLALPFDLESHRVHSGASIGIAFFPNDAKDTEDLFKFADLALYKSKAEGRGKYYLYDEEMQANMRNRKDKEAEIKQAIELNQFELYFQPKINLQSNKASGAEALIRWNHPDKGLIFPDNFIPQAEHSNLIVQLGDWVINEACRIEKKWRTEGYSLPIAVNVSAAQIKKSDFTDKLMAAIHQHQISPEFIEIEITESSILQYDDENKKVFDDIHSHGICIALDDFGTGYSSITHLKLNIAQVLKIDRSFVNNLMSDECDAALIEMLINISHKLGMKVVAEGVETQEQVQKLHSFMCDEVQGYYYQKPLPEPQFLQWLGQFHQ